MRTQVALLSTATIKPPSASVRNFLIYKLRPIIYIILHLNIYFCHISGSTLSKVNDFTVMEAKQGVIRQQQQRPYFDDVSTRNVSVLMGETAILKCRVKNKGNRTVSWMRKRDLHILTTNIYTYTGDQRFSVVHPLGSDDWDLKIEYAQHHDTGIYECQVNTEPKINLAVKLQVTDEADSKVSNSDKQYYNFKAAKAKILGSTEIHVKRDSTIALACSVNIHASSVSWYHGASIVDFDSLRGGISLETEKTDTGTTSRLMLTRASLRDSGNYTCVPAGATPASVRVHVLTGEQPAAMQTSKGVMRYRLHSRLTVLTFCFLTMAIWQFWSTTPLITWRIYHFYRFRFHTSLSINKKARLMRITNYHNTLYESGSKSLTSHRSHRRKS